MQKETIRLACAAALALCLFSARAGGLGRVTLTMDAPGRQIDLYTYKTDALQNNWWYVDVAVPVGKRAVVTLTACPKRCRYYGQRHAPTMQVSGTAEVSGQWVGCNSHKAFTQTLANHGDDTRIFTYGIDGGFRVGTMLTYSEIKSGYVFECFEAIARYEDLKPDFRVERLSASPSGWVQPDQALEFTFLVTNEGDVNTEPTTAVLTLDGKTIGTVNVPALAYGKGAELKYKLSEGLGTSGNHEVSVNVNPSRYFDDEYDIFNNTKTIKVGSPELSVAQSSVSVAATNNADIAVSVEANVAWTAEVSQSARSWLAVSDAFAASLTSLHLVAQRNPSSASRSGVVTLSNAHGQSCQVTIKQAGMTVPDAPRVVVRQQKAGQAVLVECAASARASGYSVLRAEGNAKGVYARIATVSTLPYVDFAVASGSTYYYKVVANNEIGSATSDVVSCEVLPVLSAPTLTPAMRFYGRMTVGYTHTEPGVKIFYSSDGLDPDETSSEFPDAGLTLRESMTIRARAYKDGHMFSPVAETSYEAVVVPCAPDGLSVSASELNWKAVDGARWYKVYQATDPFSEPVECSSWLTSCRCAVSAPTSWSTPLFYYVRAFSAQDESSGSGYSEMRSYCKKPWKSYYGAYAIEAQEASAFSLDICKNAGSFRIQGTPRRFYVAGDSDPDICATFDGVALSGCSPRQSWASHELLVSGTENTSAKVRKFAFYFDGDFSSSGTQWPLNTAYCFYQRGIGAFSLSASAVEARPEDGLYKIGINAPFADAAWTVSVSDGWILPYRTSGRGPSVLGFAVLRNDTGTRRTGRVIVNGLIVNIVQDACTSPITSAGTYVVEFLSSASSASAGQRVTVNVTRGKVVSLPLNRFTNGGKRFVGWQCSNGKRYDDGMLVFNLAEPGETVTMTAIWE